MLKVRAPSYRLYIFDMDGTLFRGREPTPGAVAAVNEIERGGAIVRYVTNNSSSTRDLYAAKLASMGFAGHADQVYSSARAAADWIVAHGIESVFLVGESGLEAEICAVGARVLNPGPIPGCATGADAVVAGICRGITYDWIAEAMRQIMRGAQFVATNPDATYPLEGGRLEPGAGAIVSAIQTCSSTSPIVVGKPDPYLIEMILQETGIAPGECLVVGDRVDTDIEAGRRAGCSTHLVLCGVATEAPHGQSWSNDLTGLP